MQQPREEADDLASLAARLSPRDFQLLLATLLDTNFPKYNPALQDMPREVLHRLSKHIPGASVVALALTCRTLYDQFCHAGKFQQIVAEPMEKFASLALLSPSYPGHVLCPRCVTLHPPGHRAWSPFLRHWGSSPYCCDQSFTTMRDGPGILLRKDLELLWMHIYAAVTTRRPGPWPFVDLKPYLAYMSGRPEEKIWKTRGTAAVLDGLFILRVDHVMAMEYPNTHMNSSEMQRTDTPACPHAYRSRRLADACILARDGILHQQGFRVACSACPTVYVIKIAPGPVDHFGDGRPSEGVQPSGVARPPGVAPNEANDGHVLLVTRYINCGPVASGERFPTLEWQCVTGAYAVGTPGWGLEPYDLWNRLVTQQGWQLGLQ